MPATTPSRRHHLERLPATFTYARARELGLSDWALYRLRDEHLIEALGRGIYGREPLFVSEVGPVIGAHVGPGLLGVSGVRSSLLEAR